MNSVTSFFSNQLGTHLSQFDITVVVISIVLAVAAKPIIKWLSYGRQEENRSQIRIQVMRVLNILIIGAIILKTVFTSNADASWLAKIVQVLITIYFAVLGTQVIHFFLLKRFGKQRNSGEQTIITDSYASRALSIFCGAFIAIIAAVGILQIIGLESWLQAGGVFGIVGIFLAMTQASWAPDIIGGLIILNSRRCDEGDIIQFHDNGQPIIAQVFKTKFFHTELLELTNNHRLMIRNDRMRHVILHNLSRFASAKGLRECLSFNIGYEHLEADVSAMFERAFAKFDDSTELREEQFRPEIRVLETGDYAVKWGVFYYIKNIKEMLAIRQSLLSYILDESIASDISLATPTLQEMRAEIRQVNQ
ncbi:MAG: mechanosensitive ion channel family protein [Arenicella sp.]